MTKTESLVRSIFGIVRSDIRPLIYAVDTAIELMFVQGIPMDDILVTKDVYPVVAQRLRTVSVKGISRRIERLCNQCWSNLLASDRVTEIIGAPLKDITSPRDMIFYLAFYAYLGVPFFKAIEQTPSLLFG